MHIDDNEVIKELEELDRQRQRAKTAADALREANRWSTLVNSRQALMEGEGSIDQVSRWIKSHKLEPQHPWLRPGFTILPTRVGFLM